MMWVVVVAVVGVLAVLGRGIGAFNVQFLNIAVQTLNTSVGSLPANLVAALGGSRRAEYFEAADGERGVVRVWF